MPEIRIIESKMTFVGDDTSLFHIEKCETYDYIKEGVKICELIYYDDTGGNKKLYFIEAKSSSPNPETQPNFTNFISEIKDKFENSMLLFLGLKHKRPYRNLTFLPDKIDSSNLQDIKIIICLVINGYNKEWLIPIMNKLQQELNKCKKLFAVDEIIAINDQQARRFNLIE